MSRLSISLVAALVISCSAARLKHGLKRRPTVSRDPDCPDKIRTNTKGDCFDLAGNEVPKKCCDCEEKLTEALHYDQDRMMFYVQKCEVQQTDLRQNGEDWVLLDDTRICSETCQGFEELKDGRTKESWNVDHCTEESLYQSFKMTHSVNLALDTAWNNCEALFEPVTPNQDKSVFMIDVSGSMGRSNEVCRTDPDTGEEVCKTQSRLMHVKDALPAVINGLPEDHQFALVSFSSRPGHFRNSWTNATAENKEAALKWIKDLRYRGNTNMLRAFEEVQSKYSGYDAITLLGDGEASDCRLKICLNFCPNQRCEKPVHTTLFMPGSGSAANGPRRLLQLIASKTGGKFREPFP